MVVPNASATGTHPPVSRHRTTTTTPFGLPFRKVRIRLVVAELNDSCPLGVDGWRAVNQTGHPAPVYSDTGSYIYVQSLPGQDLTFEAPGNGPLDWRIIPVTCIVF